MFLELKGFLKPAELGRLRALASTIRFVDGRSSNPHNQTKNNLQATEANPSSSEAESLLAEAFSRSEPFRDFAFPRYIAPPLLTRYDVGMAYGPHADNSHILLGSKFLRTDVSATVWLNDPSTYDGGELVVYFGTRPVVIKGEPGSVVVYPSTQLHEVTPVRRGQRLVAITFIESRIPNEFERTQLYELGEIAALEGLKMSWDGRVRLDVVRNNLSRLWSQT